MADIVCVAGSSHGGWIYDQLRVSLSEMGHNVLTPTLLGLDPEQPMDTVVNLSTHVNQIVEIVREHDFTSTVLIGHSYGGMVITGAIDRLGSRVIAALYLDAMVPEPGSRLWDYLGSEIREMFLSQCKDGYHIDPDPEFWQMRPQAVPQPIPTFLEPLHYDRKSLDQVKKTYVLATQNIGSPFWEIRDGLARQGGWTLNEMDCGHDMLVEDPEAVLAETLSVISEIET